ncbi:hypothetical protein [Propylenella binzhouense]|uniref:Uncharacterized protein n=1 Tax=Propylenella binzhouense TaxID=2555902 RepID=A0A964T3L7_9HYPH|nr:hypothetical protein [Propylenella binzhouense]MYZ47876.1 hypothetical protein [Propylenella binzhouense]
MRNLPLFALEHGLDRQERASIATALHESLRSGERLGKHWLVWVVYAAEQGYDYDGEEFWSTFEARTPLWTQRADRTSLRNWFRKFHTAYGGFKPTGPWANWFSIIAWPITHALLPKDLQQQLARALYQLRFQVAARIESPPADLGRYIARFSQDASSRFRNFLEQEEIVGRIVLALLGGRAAEAQHFIHPPTLARVVEDLERARSARAWLRDARQAVERAQMKGASRGLVVTRGQAANEQSEPQKSAAPYIRPRLTLRRTGTSEWTPVVELPSLRPIADLHPDVGHFLRRTRCTVAGSAGALPAGWLASGDQRRVLAEWPATGQPMVRFESQNAVVENLLQSDGCISSGPLWVFRVGPDGLAHEIIGRLVRPGRTYVLVSRETLPIPALAEAAVLRCAGVQAWVLRVPDQLSAADIVAFKALGLSVAQTVRIRPAGLDARRWDGEGFSEWVEGETPCFALESDFPLAAYDLRLNGEQSVRVSAAGGQLPLFIKLPALSTGQHQLMVRAIRADGGGDAALAPVEGFVSLVVRPPQPWSTGSAGHNGLVVTAEPAEPSLDRLWEGEVALQIFGPSGRRVSAWVELLDGGGDQLSSEKVAELTLPTTPSAWERALASFLQRDRDPWAYLSASAGTLIVDGEALGSHRVPLTRDVSPVRWVWHKTQRSTALRLVDDHEGDDPLHVMFYPFAAPAEGVPISRDVLATAWVPDGIGGLCVASYGAQRQALVASMPQVVGGFAGLLVQPVIRSLPTGDEAVLLLHDLIQLWSGARLTGPLAGQRRDRAVEGLAEQLIRLLCGADWAAAEAAYKRSSRGEHDLRRLADRVGGPPAFAFVLARDAILYRSMGRDERLNHFAGLADRYGVARREACSAALDLCDTMGRYAPLDRPAVSRLVAASRPWPAVIRGARLIHIATPVRSAAPLATSAPRRG